MVLTELQFIINIYQFFTLHLALCHRDLTSAIYCRERNNRSSRPKLFCKKMFFKIPQNLEENTSSRASLLIDCRFIKIKKEKNFFSCEFGEIFKNIFFYRTSSWLLFKTRNIQVSWTFICYPYELVIRFE